MTAPTRHQAARLLRSLDPPEWLVRHSCAVADVAAWLATRARSNDQAVDVELVAVAALLHDVDKLPSVAVPDHLRHGEGSAWWLAGRGWLELDPLVRDHPVGRLAEPGHATWSRTASLEARIVAYADKRAGQHLESMDERFASWRLRYPAGPTDPSAGGGTSGSGWDDTAAERVLARARDLELDVCRAAGVEPAEVRRLRWSTRAVREAAA
jgi:hypothetical protein